MMLLTTRINNMLPDSCSSVSAKVSQNYYSAEMTRISPKATYIAIKVHILIVFFCGYVGIKPMTLALLDLFRTWSHKNKYLCALSVRHHLRTLLHVLPQFQREMSTEWR